MDCRGSEEPAGLRVLMSFRNVEHEWSRKQTKKTKQIKLLQLDLDHITSLKKKSFMHKLKKCKFIIMNLSPEM